MHRKIILLLRIIYIVFYIILPFIALNLSIKRVDFLGSEAEDLFFPLAFLVAIIIGVNIALTYKKLPQTLSGMLSLVGFPLIAILSYMVWGGINWRESVLQLSFIYISVNTIGYFYFVYHDAVGMVGQLPFIAGGAALAGLIWLALDSAWPAILNLSWVIILDSFILGKNIKNY